MPSRLLLPAPGLAVASGLLLIAGVGAPERPDRTADRTADHGADHGAAHGAALAVAQPAAQAAALTAAQAAALTAAQASAQMSALAVAQTPAQTPAQTAAQVPACTPDAGFTLPDGFCAVLVAEGLPSPRHLVVTAEGDLFVAAAGRQGSGGGIWALRDADGDGRAERRERIGEVGGTGIALEGGALYFAPDDRVLRYTVPRGSLVPSAGPQVVVSGLPDRFSHAAKSIALDGRGGLYVNVGSPSNVCQPRTAERTTSGVDPCPELRDRAGIWRFDARRTGQSQADGERVATGVRNAVALRWRAATGALYAVVHGRDQLHQLFPELYDETEGAEKPAEELIRIDPGDDFGWPYCYYDPIERRKELAPEYGGDDERQGRCAEAEDPIWGFPGHWAPNGLLFYTGSSFPARYRGGAFIAFHGSWNRAPRPQGGYNVTFLPLAEDRPAGEPEVFMDGWRGRGTGDGPGGRRAAARGSRRGAGRLALRHRRPERHRLEGDLPGKRGGELTLSEGRKPCPRHRRG